ncbi:MAG: hypothetical protein WD846_04110 [Patescibacteria group bacterium]
MEIFISILLATILGIMGFLFFYMTFGGILASITRHMRKDKTNNSKPSNLFMNGQLYVGLITAITLWWCLLLILNAFGYSQNTMLLGLVVLVIVSLYWSNPSKLSGETSKNMANRTFIGMVFGYVFTLVYFLIK